MRERGFTLIEMVVGIAVFATILAGVMSLLYESQWAFQSQAPMNRSAEEARIAMDQMIRYIRLAGNDPAGALKAAGTPPIEILGTNHIRVNSDITGSVSSVTANSMESTGDPDGSLSSLQERVEFRYDQGGRRLIMNVGLGEVVVADNISAFQMRFFDGSQAETADSSAVLRISIRMVAESDRPDLRTGLRNQLVLHSDVFVRSKSYSPFEILEDPEVTVENDGTRVGW